MQTILVNPTQRPLGRPARLATLALAAALASGCTVCESARDVLITQPKQFFWERDRKDSRALYLAWAEEAWASEAARGACGEESTDYAWGFREGFADFVYGGGTGEPPAVPPRPYWNAMNRTDDGKAAADAWFAGYRHGAAAARSGGYRDQAVVRSSIARQVSFAQPSYDPATGEPAFLGPALATPAAEGELVPLPSPDPASIDGEATPAIEGAPAVERPSTIETAPEAPAIDAPDADTPGLEFPQEPVTEPTPKIDRSAQRGPAVARPASSSRLRGGASLLRY